MPKPRLVPTQPPSQPKPNLDLKDFTFLSDHVLLHALRKEAVAGLVSPEQYDDNPEFGEVVAVGEGKMLDDGVIVTPKVTVGDVVFFGKYSSVKTRSLGKDWYIVRSEDIMAIAPK